MGGGSGSGSGGGGGRRSRVGAGAGAGAAETGVGPLLPETQVLTDCLPILILLLAVLLWQFDGPHPIQSSIQSSLLVALGG